MSWMSFHVGRGWALGLPFLISGCPSLSSERQEPGETTALAERDAEDRRIVQEVRGVVAAAEGSGRFALIQVSCHDGIVKLLGPVGSGEEKALIGGLAQQVRGVRRIDNQLDVVSTRAREADEERPR